MISRVVVTSLEMESKLRLFSAGGYYKRYTCRGSPFVDAKGEMISRWAGQTDISIIL
jgi:hypothetical protein